MAWALARAQQESSMISAIDNVWAEAHATKGKPRRRLHWLLAGFVIACAGIFARLIALEVGSGDEYRAEAARPTVQRRDSRDARADSCSRRDGAGRRSAVDRDRRAVSLSRRAARSALVAGHRALAIVAARGRQAGRVADEEARVCEERDAMHRRLAELCGISLAEWQSRCRRIQARVDQLAQRVNSRRKARDADANGAPAASESSDESWLSSASRGLFKALFQANADPPAIVAVAEEFHEHVVFEGAPLEAVAEIEGNPQRYPGVAVIHASRRIYPAGNFAAHLLGYVHSQSIAATYVGQAGIERQYDALLRGQDGSAVDQFDRRGRLQSTTIERPSTAGRDLVVTIEPALHAWPKLSG